MKKHIPRLAWIILALHLIATALLLIFGYGVQKPAVQKQEFPFTAPPPDEFPWNQF